MVTLTARKLLRRLVENAVDFLARSIEELKDHPKYSVIHFHAAVELFLKARLLSEHWSLVVSNRREADWEKFVSGDFHSVSLDEAAVKLEKIVRSGLSERQLKVFREVAKHRNKMVHFFHDAHSKRHGEQRLQAIARQQLKAWLLLHELLTGQWAQVFKPWSERIEKLNGELRKHKEFLQVVFDSLQKEIRECRKAGSLFLCCPSCGFESQQHMRELDEIYDAKCLVCGLVERYLRIECSRCNAQVNFVREGYAECNSCGKKYEPKDVVDTLLDASRAHSAATDGDDSWNLGNCGVCDGYHTVVRVGDHYVCAHCFESFDSVEWCEWCNEPNTGDMEDSFFLGCSQCDGKIGWDDD